jgi:hypothetical protein
MKQVTIEQIRNGRKISSIEMNFPDDMNYIREIHQCFQNNCPTDQINFYLDSDVILGRIPFDPLRRLRLKKFTHKFKVAI